MPKTRVGQLVYPVGLLVLVGLLLGLMLPAPRLKAAEDEVWINVVGGQDASPGQFPHIASLRRNGGHFCGGDLIKVDWVVTAAHCVQGSSPSSIVVKLGDHLRTTAEASEQDIPVIRIVVHTSGDIALLQLSRAATINDRVKTIPLATTADAPFYSDNKPATIAGWGGLYSGGPLPNTLQYANELIHTDGQCTIGVNSNEVCWGSNYNNISGCNGDSGGPLVINVNGVWKLLGKVSWGQGCRGSTAFAKVPSYVSWITSYTGPLPGDPATPTPGGPTATRTRTSTPGGPTATRTPTAGSSTNLALNKPATASAYCNTSETAPRAVDGSTSTKWCDNTSSSKWLRVDLGTTQTVGRFTITHAGSESSSYITRAFNIQVSSDNVNWTTVSTVTSNTLNNTSHTITPRSARYVRLVVTQGQQTGSTARIYEFRVFSS